MLSSVFHIFVRKVEPDLTNILNPGNKAQTAASGFGVELKLFGQTKPKKYIVTNAHVTEYATFIECNKYNSDKRFVLEIIDSCLGFDLSVLAVNEQNYD